MIIKSADSTDFKTAVEWAANEGWNPGLDDLAAFYEADPSGFLMGYVDGVPVASISVVRYGDEFGFLGFYIVAPTLRGKGLGWQLWQAGMTYLEGRTVGLDGVVEQQANYSKSGFQFVHNNIRFAGSLPSDNKVAPQIVSADAVEFADLLSYDQQFFPADRRNFLKAWVGSDADSRHTVAFVAHDRVTGMGTIRRCRHGFKVGPLYADEPRVAEEILLALANHAKGEEMFLDVPQPNEAAGALARKYGMEPTFETARMYRGSDPQLPLERIYGITTFELG